ncbi:unnamed protein product [Phytophthora lilii]|uniref:Unnamed protein product n=1 Tax=Phytophthora lilii TaxID=2077276 RepID=A0A9W7CK50_9STRA|nr:unnamed protein product [Phytophthora lilii]
MTLTQQKEALTAKLIRLQQAHEETKEGDEKNRSTLALSAWRATAARQKELRREAEALQQKLKEAVWCQSAVIQNLNVTLQQSLSNRPVKRLTSVDGQESGTKAKSALFNVLMGELNALYAETGDLVRGARCEFQRPDVNKMRRKWNQDRSLLRSTVATIVPADFERTWRALSLILLSDDSGIHYTGKIVDPENTIVMTYQQTFSLKSGKTATSVVYYAARRYIEENRVVFVWRVLNEGHGEFASLLSNEHAWLVISHFASTQTLLESYSRLMPIGMGDTSLRDGSRLDQFVQHLLKADEAEINDVNLAMERLLSQKHTDDDNKCD